MWNGDCDNPVFMIKIKLLTIPYFVRNKNKTRFIVFRCSYLNGTEEEKAPLFISFKNLDVVNDVQALVYFTDKVLNDRKELLEVISIKNNAKFSDTSFKEIFEIEKPCLIDKDVLKEFKKFIESKEFDIGTSIHGSWIQIK